MLPVMPSARSTAGDVPGFTEDPVGVIHDQIAEFIRQTRLQREDMYGDLTYVAYGTLLFVANSECAHASDLCAAYGLDKSTVSRQLTDLINRDLLVRESDPHHVRMQRLKLTPRGRRILLKLRKRQRANLENTLEEWSAKDVQRFADLFRRFVQAASTPASEQLA